MNPYVEAIETPEPHPLFKNRTILLLSFLVLHGLIFVHAFQWYTYAVFAGSKPHPFLYLRYAAEIWYCRAGLAPIILWYVHRYPLRADRWARNVCACVLLSLVIASAGSLLQSAVASHIENHGTAILSVSYLDGTPTFLRPLTRFEQLLVRGWPHFVYNMFTCWMLIGLMQGIQYYRQLQSRELLASRLQTQLARVRLEALRMQLNPHFLFNTLHAISTLIHEDPDAADEMLLRMAELLRMLLSEQDEPEIPLHRELALLECQLGIEQVRFRDRLITNIRVSPELLDCAVPQLILQPLVENAIRHGIGRRSGSDEIDVLATEVSGRLELEVRNKYGSLETSTGDSSRRGIGLQNTQLRLRTLYKDDHSMSLQNLSPCGVSVNISLPIRHIVDETE